MRNEGGNDVSEKNRGKPIEDPANPSRFLARQPGNDEYGKQSEQQSDRQDGVFDGAV